MRALCIPFRIKSLIYLTLVLVLFIIIWKLDSEENVTYPGDLESHQEEIFQENQLFDLHKFKYILESNVCLKQRTNLLGIILVTSYVGHDDVRAAHREGISQSELLKLGLARVFLLAKIPSKEKFITQNGIASEQRKFGDLVQGDFIENYRNLTYKHVMGLRWAVSRCSHAKFIIKIDDDSVYDIFRVYKYLKANENDSGEHPFLAGYIFNHQKPIRIEADKHFVAESEYSGDEFPRYLSGWLYITNPFTSRLLIKETMKKPFFWIDDTYVTGILAEDLSIDFIDLTEWFSANPDFLECCVKDLIRFQLECEFVVGPNGGDTKLLPLFQAEARKCFQNNSCRERKGPGQNLRNTCVTANKDLLRANHGSAIIRPIKL